MNKTSKFFIVFALIVAVATVIAIKQNGKKTNVSENPQTITQNDAEDKDAASNLVQTPKLPKLVDLGAGKCIPCKMMAPILEEIKKEYADKFEVVFIDVWENPEEKEPYNIKMIPTQIFFDASGKELFRHEGFFSKENILNKWKELGIDFGNVANNTTDQP
ncbi:MAG: thioredoxin family protein [Phycisphaerae bacterium]|nr:thioredoxin family protein [Phycisphaerae bacterium]